MQGQSEAALQTLISAEAKKLLISKIFLTPEIVYSTSTYNWLCHLATFLWLSDKANHTCENML